MLAEGKIKTTSILAVSAGSLRTMRKLALKLQAGPNHGQAASPGRDTGREGVGCQVLSAP